MKLFMRLFTCILSLVLLSFAVFGTLFFHSSFTELLHREQEANTNQTKMLVYALLSSVDGAENEYVPKRADLAAIMRTLDSNFSNTRNGFALYNSTYDRIYESGIPLEQNMLRSLQAKPDSIIQKIVSPSDTHLLASIAGLRIHGETYMLVISEDIEYLYSYRQKMYGYYCILTAAVIFLSACISFVLSYHFSKPIAALSKTALCFAEGDYQKRSPVTGHDEITDLMKSFNLMADKIEENITALAEAARRQEEFTGAFAHELKTPLTSIIGYSDMLRSVELSDDEKITAADFIYQQGKRLERLSHSMLSLTELSHAGQTIQQISAASLFAEVEAMTRYMMEQDGIDCRFFLKDAHLTAEKDLLVTVFCNLLDNARKACTNAPGKIAVLGGAAQDSYVVKIIDNGCGIPAADIPKVQEAFFMVDKSRSRKAGGAGLGLTLCGKILDLHKGTLEIRSQEGTGTIVTVKLPLSAV